MSNSIDKAFNSFISQAQTKKKREEEISRINAKIVAEKDQILNPIRQLLQRLVELNIWVYDKNKFERTLPRTDGDKLPPRLFEVFEDPSSPTWLPGNSIYIEHPADIEIAVVSEQHREKQGLIIITCKENPYANILTNRIFRDVDSACMALSEFLSKNLVNVDRLEHDTDDDINLIK